MLVTEGIYGRVRHPMYTAFWLWAVAQALLLPNWIAGFSGLIGFGTLINSSYAPLHVFGIVSVVTLTCCVVSSVVFLPALVLQMERWSRSAR